MAGFSRFNKRWAATGVVANPTENQADQGFAFLGESAPSVELFNALHRDLDEKDNWLYARVAEVLTAAGVTPSEATQNQLLTAMRVLFAPGIAIFTASGTFTVPAGVTRIKGRVWGAGGGGGSAAGADAAGTGGGGGGYSEGVFPVTPMGSLFITVGVGGNGQFVNGASAQPGGSTSIGTLCSASGGAAGVGSTSGIPGIGIPGGTGVGGSLNLQGQFGGYGQLYRGTATGGGIGGGSPLGGGLSHLSIGATGNAGTFPGGGACGAGTTGAGSSNSGGRGANGLAIIEW